MKRLIFWLITLAVSLAACWTYNPSTMPNEYASISVPSTLDSPQTITDGQAIFMTNCAECHGSRGDGQGVARPAFGPPPANLTDRAKMSALSPQYLFWRVSEGGRVEPYRSQGSIMPAWKYQLSVDERWQVVAYVRTLSR
ncbi:MAG: cytochrome c [Anaerolineae bacterium]